MATKRLAQWMQLLAVCVCFFVLTVDISHVCESSISGNWRMQLMPVSSTCWSFFGRLCCLYLWFVLFSSFPLTVLATCPLKIRRACSLSVICVQRVYLVVATATRIHTTRTCFVEQMAYRALLCRVFGYCAVGQLLVVPSSPLSDWENILI